MLFIVQKKEKFVMNSKVVLSSLDPAGCTLVWRNFFEEK